MTLANVQNCNGCHEVDTTKVYRPPGVYFFLCECTRPIVCLPCYCVAIHSSVSMPRIYVLIFRAGLKSGPEQSYVNTWKGNYNYEHLWKLLHGEEVWMIYLCAITHYTINSNIVFTQRDIQDLVSSLNDTYTSFGRYNRGFWEISVIEIIRSFIQRYMRNMIFSRKMLQIQKQTLWY